MKNIGQLTYFGTNNYTDNFLELTSENDLNNDFSISNTNIFVLGSGSNVLFSKNIYNDTLFIKNNYKGIKDLGDGYFSVNSGELLITFVKYIVNNFNSNILNPIFGLPGTVGGAVIGNAGSFGIEVGNFVHKIKYINEYGKIIETDDYKYSYRHSNLIGKKIILLEVVFKLDLNKKFNCESCKYYMQWRINNHENSKTCGSYFKSYFLDYNKDSLIIEKILSIKNNIINKYHPNGLDSLSEIKIPAGWLIDQCNLRGFSYNGVKISDKHANFFLNYDNSDSNNILKLSEIVKNKVYDKFGIKLEEEVIII